MNRNKCQTLIAEIKSELLKIPNVDFVEYVIVGEDKSVQVGFEIHDGISEQETNAALKQVNSVIELVQLRCSSRAWGIKFTNELKRRLLQISKVSNVETGINEDGEDWATYEIEADIFEEEFQNILGQIHDVTDKVNEEFFI